MFYQIASCSANHSQRIISGEALMEYVPPQFSIEMELEHEHIKAVMVKSLSPFTFLIAYCFPPVLQQKASFIKWSRCEDATIYSTHIKQSDITRTYKCINVSFCLFSFCRRRVMQCYAMPTGLASKDNQQLYHIFLHFFCIFFVYKLHLSCRLTLMVDATSIHCCP